MSKDQNGAVLRNFNLVFLPIFFKFDFVEGFAFLGFQKSQLFDFSAGACGFHGFLHRRWQILHGHNFFRFEHLAVLVDLKFEFPAVIFIFH